MTKTAEKPGIALTPDQEGAVQAVLGFWREGKGRAFMTLGGFAGTGKTTVIGEAVVRHRKKEKGCVIAFCAFTGRAASVLRGKLERVEALELADHCGTIHSLIYTPKVQDGVIVGWKKADTIPHDLIVVDEASMLTKTLWDDLLSFGKPILAVGDHGQLPPVGDAFNLMADPHVRLERIHRQAEGDPIIKLSLHIREHGNIPVGRHGEFVSKVVDRKILERIPDVSDPLILCGYNRSRVGLNRYIRQRLGFKSPLPMAGERVICLKNNATAGVYNGMTGMLKSVKADGKDHLKIVAEMDGGVTFDGLVWRPQFGAEKTIRPESKQQAREMGDFFDWGYAMTVHKSQGSEARRVVLFEERMQMMTDDDWRRWLYTGVTRARERLLIVGS